MAGLSSSLALNRLIVDSMVGLLLQDVCIEEHRLAAARLRNRVAVASTSTLLAPPIARNASGSSLTGSSPGKKEKDDPPYECLNCQRMIAAPRYASHMSGCMGLGARRGEKRGAANSTTGNGNGGNGTKTGNGLLRVGSDRASSYQSDEDSMSGVDKKTSTHIKLSSSSTSTNNKRSSSQPLSASTSKFKKPRPLTPVPGSLSSHPLAKTLSAPSSPVKPLPPTPSHSHPTTSPGPIRPPPSSQVHNADRPDSDSESDDSGDDKKGGSGHTPLPQRPQGAKKTIPFEKRRTHPLAAARGIESESGSEGEPSASEDSGSD